MKSFIIQMLDGDVSSDWWNDIIRYFVKVGDEFEFVVGKRKFLKLKRLAYMENQGKQDMKYL